MSKVTCLQWHTAFQKGRDSCELQGGPSALVTAQSDMTIDTAGCLIATNHHLTIRELAGILDTSLGSVHTLLHDHLNVLCICACWIPRLLTPEQKKQCVTLCKYWPECVHKEGDRWWKTIITASESWIYAYDPATKQQSTEWVKKGERPPKKGRRTKSAQKVMVITFFDYPSVSAGTEKGDWFRVLHLCAEAVDEEVPILWKLTMATLIT